MRLLALVLLASCAHSPPRPNAAPLVDAQGHRVPFTNEHVRVGIEATRPAVARCFEEHKQKGEAYLQIAITPHGEVVSVRTVSGLMGTPLADCLESAVRSTRFPPFLGGIQIISYPFSFR
jgi:hypothetical protein